MRYIALCRKCAIMTDDYDPQEVAEGLHIKHLKRDIQEWQIEGAVNVFDENNKFICQLFVKNVA